MTPACALSSIHHNFKKSHAFNTVARIPELRKQPCSAPYNCERTGVALQSTRLDMSARGTQEEATKVLRESNTAANRGNMEAADTATKAADSSAPTTGARKPKAVLVEVGATASCTCA